MTSSIESFKRKVLEIAEACHGEYKYAVLVLQGVDTDGKYFACRLEMPRPDMGWQNITEIMKSDEDAGIFETIIKNSSFDLFTVEDILYEVKADVTII